jgi:dTMP kinase
MAERLARGVLVAIEGIDGAGKTTQVELLHGRLAGAGLDVVRTKEPTTGRYGRMLRESATTGRLPAAQELELFIADRREHVDALIRPALADGQVVIVDRYYFSNAAYQGARGMDPQAIVAANEQFAPLPDLLVLLRISTELSQQRIAARGDGSGNLFEQVDALRRAAAIFDQIDRPFVLRIDGGGPRESIHDEIVRALERGPIGRRLDQNEGRDA